MKYLLLIGYIVGLIVYIIGWNYLLKKMIPALKPAYNNLYKKFIKIDEEIAQTKRFSPYEDNHRYNPGDPTNPNTYKHVSFKIVAALIGMITIYNSGFSRFLILFWAAYMVMWLIGLVVFMIVKSERVRNFYYSGLLQLMVTIVLMQFIHFKLY